MHYKIYHVAINPHRHPLEDFDMNVKGTAYLTGKVSIIAAFGEQRWNSFIAKLAAKDNFFSNMIMSVTPIPLEKIILFLEEMLKEFFNNDHTQYSMFGKVAAKFALSPGGPYNSYVNKKDIKQFFNSGMPKLWSIYFDGSILTGQLENNFIHLKLTGLSIKHIYFEYMLIGYLQQILKMFGKKIVKHRMSGFVPGESDIHYKCEIKDY